MRKCVVACCVSCGLALELGVRSPKCSDGWADFGPDKPLTTSQIVHHPEAPLSFREFDHGSMYQGLFIHPPSNFAFCTIEKNGCSAWTTVLRKIWLNSTKANTVAHGISKRAFKKWGYKHADRIFSDSSALRAVMIRDPLARFASVFLNKCFSHNCTNPYCFPRRQEDRGRPISFKAAVDFMLMNDPAKLEGHWKLQSEHCELKSRVHEFTVLGFMDKAAFATDAACIMERAGLSALNGDGNGNRFFEEGVAEVNPTMLSGKAKEESVLKMMYTKEAARQLMDHMKQDYKLFNMVEPAWVAEATGEWYTVASGTCSSEMRSAPHSRKTGAGGHLEALLEEDDVAAGAEKAGFYD